MVDEKLKEKSNRRIMAAELRIEDLESKCLLEIIKLQAQRIEDLENHMEWAIGKLQKHSKALGLPED